MLIMENVRLRKQQHLQGRCFTTLASSSSSSSSSPSSTLLTDREQETLTLVRRVVEEEIGIDAWNEAVSCLATFLQSPIQPDAAATTDDADSVSTTHDQAAWCLAEAFGWKKWVLSSSTLRKYQTQPIVPSVESLEETMDWLLQGPLQLQKDPALLQTCLLKYPALYIKDPQTLYRRAIQSAPRAYRDAAAFRTLLRQDPSVLDVFYNCGDEDDGCASNCGNCWVTYQRR
ncbi:hypothetical protein MPSEU_000106700 [Mayamaea pseudoterrestris]|nr:hypothetical protein MPSEU_000106700 [Mayamaea pseudoterrestris]